MPELPDVETFRRYLDSTSLHQAIAHTHVQAELLEEGVTPQLLQRRLKGAEITETGRRGKYLFGRLTNQNWLVLHFGMTGFLRYFRDGGQAPNHTRLLLEFDNGYFLAYDCQRKLGTIAITEDLERFIQDKDLGPDAWGLSYSEFHDALKDRRGMIKSALMNQSIFAGIGNVYSDEILFQSRLHPATKVSELEEEGLRRIFDAMAEVLETTIRFQADPDRFPPSYLTPCRDPGAKCPRCDGLIRHSTISGRTAYYCPDCQATETSSER